MTTETGTPHSRRVVLAGALGAAAAAAASALGRPAPARAADGQPLLLNVGNTTWDGTGTNEATGTTYIFSKNGAGLYAQTHASDGTALYAIAAHQSSATTGVYGRTYSPLGTGVSGYSAYGDGITFGVVGKTESSLGTGVYGSSPEMGTGVFGLSVSGHGAYGSSTSGFGLYGTSGSSYGVSGHSDTSIGAYAKSNSYIGVFGESPSSNGVVGYSNAPDYAGAVGSNDGGNTGLFGFSGVGAPPATPAKTGVYGYAVQDANARGVTGQTTAGRGVNGIATTGTGVYGIATTGYALRAVGRVKLDKCAGVATIAAGTKSIVVTPGIDLTSSSAVVASLMGSAGGTTTVHRSVVSTTANTLTIYLTANATANVKVAWHVFG